MTIQLNGEPYAIDGPVSISALLAALKIDSRIVAVEHNVVVVKRQYYDDTKKYVMATSTLWLLVVQGTRYRVPGTGYRHA